MWKRVCGFEMSPDTKHISSFHPHQHLLESESIPWRIGYSLRCIRIVKGDLSRCQAMAEMTNPVSLAINHSYLALIVQDSAITDKQIAAFAPWLNSHSCLTPPPQSVMTRFQFAKRCGWREVIQRVEGILDTKWMNKEAPWLWMLAARARDPDWTPHAAVSRSIDKLNWGHSLSIRGPTFLADCQKASWDATREVFLLSAPLFSQ